MAEHDSSERERILLQGDPLEGILVLDGAGATTFANAPLAASLGHDSAELESLSFWDLLHPDNAAGTRAAFDAVLASGKPQTCLFRLRRQQGSFAWFEGRIANRLADSRVSGVTIVVRDITERMRVSAEYARDAERFRLGAKHANVGVWDWNIITGELWWSEQVGRLFGFGADVPETTYENFLKCVHPEDRELVTASVNRAVYEHAAYDIHHRVVWPGGTVRWVNERGSVMYGNNGTPVRMLGVVQDVTERHQAELLQSRLIGILEASPDLVCLADENGRVVYMNPAGRRLVGAGDAALPESLEALHLPAERERVARMAVPRALQSGEWTGESVLVTAAGQEIPVIESIVVHRDAAEHAIFLATICRDVSEAKKVQRIKDELISTVNHELRTPLTSIRGTLGLLLGGVAGALEPEGRQLLEVAERNTARLTRLINDFLDVAKIEAGERLVLPADANLAQLVDQSVDMMQGYASQYGVGIRWQRPAEGVAAFVDTERFLQVMTNLLSNAVKFSPAQQTVDVAIMPLGRWVRVSVADRGPGIPHEFRDRIFQKFAQADASDQRPRQGSGLGLSISKSLVVSMGGCIAFGQRPGGGTIFEVDVPSAAMPAAPNTSAS